MSEESSKLVVRRYIPSDYDGVAHLVEMLAHIYNDEFNDFYFRDLMQVRVIDSSMGTFIAEYDGLLAGTCFAEITRDPRGYLHGRITNLTVAEGYQNLGIGNALLEEAFKFLSFFSVPSIWANVNPQSENMIHIFQKRDFHYKFFVMEKYAPIFSPKPAFVLSEGDIKFRGITMADLPAVKGFVQELARLYEVEFNDFWFDLTSTKYFQDPTARIFVADRNDEIIGTAFAEVKRDPIGYVYGHITNVFVQENTRGSGIATNLIQLAMAFLLNMNITKVWGNAFYNDGIAQHIYEKLGFHYKFTVMDKQINRALFGNYI